MRVCGGGECPDFPSNFSCLTVPKHLVEDPLCAVFQKIPGIEKFWIRGGEEYQDFPSKIYCLTVQKIFVGAPFINSLILGTEKLG